MKSLVTLIALLVAMVILLAIFTNYEPGTATSKARFAGWPVVSVTATGGRGLIALGWAGQVGVIVISQAGMGVITFAQAGLGVLFGIGQLMAGFLVLGQLGLGIAFFIGQVGGGVHAMGQGVGKRWPKEVIEELSDELSAVLRPPWARGPAKRAKLRSDS